MDYFSSHQIARLSGLDGSGSESEVKPIHRKLSDRPWKTGRGLLGKIPEKRQRH